MSKKFCIVILACAAIAAPLAASAHEVYVLSRSEIAQAVWSPSPNPFSAIPSQEKLFLIWGTIVAVSLLLVLTASVTPLFERVFDPLLSRLKKYAPLVGRLTFGLALIYSGYHGAFFGPELPVAATMPAGLAQLIGVALMIGGFMVCIGFLTRLVSVVALVVYAYAVLMYGTYMLTYLNYLGEIILFIILGGGIWSVDSALPFFRTTSRRLKRFGRRLEKYSFFILRLCFGTALFYASFYAKFLHSNLALDTVNDYHLTNYFHFTPLFLVLGAFLIEALLGLCFAAGFEIRFAALFFTFFLTLSIMFFGEAVWPHIILFGVNIALFFHGYDQYTLEMKLIQRARKGEPVL
ncbi:MAG: DoxX family protein [Patescibacteria group bacterium]|nr:DoxX family protein [Patescibacteria group bacterium]MDE2172811.1 DoxX family protein [Patescibacteria group bacterium]